MSRQDDDLNNLLFSRSSHYDDNRLNHKQQNDVFGTYIDDGDQEQQFQFNINNKEPWRQSEALEHQFMQVNGPSIEFQNCSNSMMLSQRQDEDSRDYKYEMGRDYKLIEKKGEDVHFDSVLDKELTQTKQQLQINNLQVTKLQTVIKGLESKLKNKQSDIMQLQMNVNELQQELQKVQRQKDQCLQMMAKKDDFFTQYRKEMTKLFQDLNQKQLQNQMQQEQLLKLTDEIQKLKIKISSTEGIDKKNKELKSYGQLQTQNIKRNSYSEREVQKIKKQLSQVKQNLNDKQNRLKLLDEENRKKIIYKERKIQELQEKISELKQENLRSNTQNELNIQKYNASVNTKAKQIASLKETIDQSERRIKSLFSQTKKKDQKIRDIAIELLEKGKRIEQINKELEQARVKLQFDHLMITEKEQEIQKLHDERKNIKNQLQTQKIDKVDKNQKNRKQREWEKIKKDFDCLKKNYENLERQKNQLSDALMDATKKVDQATKKAQQFKQKYANLQKELNSKNLQSDEQFDHIDKVKKELSDHKKKADLVPELKNKIIILESRLKQRQTQRKDNFQNNNSLNMIDKIEALEHRLEQRQKQIKSLKNELKNSNTQDQQQYENMRMQLADRENQIQKLLQDLQKKQLLLEELKIQLQFKDNTLEYTHTILIKSEKAKIELQQEKKMLEEKLDRDYDQNNEQQTDEMSEFYESKIQHLQQNLHHLEIIIRQKQEELIANQQQHKFQTRQLKERLKELSNLTLQNKERKITPQTMSQEDTVNFLTKTIKRVYRSTDMLKLLDKNRQFKQILIRMQKQFRK